MQEQTSNSGANNRKSFRFNYAAPVDIIRGTERYSFGMLIDLSRDGAAFKAYAPLPMGSGYEFHIRGVGAFSGTIVRRFNGESYAVRFDIEEAVKRRIDKTLAALFDSDDEHADVKTSFSA